MSSKLLVILIINVFVGSLAQIFLKDSLKAFGKTAQLDFSLLIEIVTNYKLILAISMYVISLMLYMYLLSNSNLGRLFSIYVSASIIVVYIMDIAYFNTPVKSTSIAGIAIIIMGIVIMRTGQ